MHPQTMKCQICSLQSHEVQIIVKALFIRMENLKYEVIKPLKDHGQQDSFTKLINSFFKLNPLIKQDSLKCSHKHLMNIFTENIRCTIEGLNQASDFVLMQQIKKSYELEVLTSQIRQVSGEIGKGIFQPGVNKHQMFPHLITQQENSENFNLKIQNQQEQLGKKCQIKLIPIERQIQKMQKSHYESQKIPFTGMMNYYTNQNNHYPPYQGYYYYGHPYYYRSAPYQNTQKDSQK